MYFYETRNREFDCNIPNNLSFLAHLHKQVELIIVLDGKIETKINGNSRELKKGDVFIAFPNEIHEYHTEESSRCLLWIFDCDILPDFADIFRLKVPNKHVLRAEDTHSDVKNCAKQIYKRKELRKNTVLGKSFLNIILAHILPNLALQDVELKTDLDWMRKVFQYISANFKQGITLEKISAHIGVSKYHLSRTFQKQVGCSLPFYINTLRANYAVRLLETTELSVTQIAYDCGFESQTTFFRVFRELGMKTPREYRKDGRAVVVEKNVQ